MFRKGGVLLSVVIGLCLPLTLLAAAEVRTDAPRLTAAQILDKHFAARGGAHAWQAVQTMSWTGKMEAGTSDSSARSAAYLRNQWSRGAKLAHAVLADAKKGATPQTQTAAQQVQLPFVFELKRPGKSRVELEFAGKTAVQVYDGRSGWMLRPYLNRNDWEPFTAEQAQAQASLPELDGPLFDSAAKGTKVELEGVEPVDGHSAYKLKLTLKSGDVRHVWVDAHSFLDVKVEGTPRRMDGRMRAVWVYQRDFRSVQGLMVPFLLQTTVEGYREAHDMVVDKVAVNPKLDDALFEKPKA
jgi:hypothetical protein